MGYASTSQFMPNLEGNQNQYHLPQYSYFPLASTFVAITAFNVSPCMSVPEHDGLWLRQS